MGSAGGDGCAVEALHSTVLPEQVWIHAGLSQLNKLLSALLLLTALFFSPTELLWYWYIQPKLLGLKSE